MAVDAFLLHRTFECEDRRATVPVEELESFDDDRRESPDFDVIRVVWVTIDGVTRDVGDGPGGKWCRRFNGEVVHDDKHSRKEGLCGGIPGKDKGVVLVGRSPANGRDAFPVRQLGNARHLGLHDYHRVREE